jgi:hypothetical protein
MWKGDAIKCKLFMNYVYTFIKDLKKINTNDLYVGGSQIFWLTAPFADSGSPHIFLQVPG